MPAPYVTSTVLMRRPASIAFASVPTLVADDAEQTAQLDGICQEVTSQVDGYLNQPARAECVTHVEQGPGRGRVSVDRNTGLGVLTARRWPVLNVDAVQVSRTRSFPSVWTRVPAQDCRAREPVLRPASGDVVTSPSGGAQVDVAPGWIDWREGRAGWTAAYSLTCGHGPHTMLSAAADTATAGAPQVLAVDDVTGWTGWSGWILDGPGTEPVTVTGVSAAAPAVLPDGAGTVQAGPGILTLAAPLKNAHTAGCLLTALPQAVLQAAALKVAVVALETIAGIAVQSSSGRLPGGLGALAYEAECNLQPYAMEF